MGCKMCEKTKVKCRNGLWSPNEDQKLKDYILKHGHGCWSSVPLKAGLQRNGKSCRLRWINYLRPGLKRGAFTAEEEATIVKFQTMWGNKWSRIAMHLPGRTDNEVKNYWNTYLKKKLPEFDKYPSKYQPPSTSSPHSDIGNSKPEQQSEENNNIQISFSESSISQESSYSASPRSIINNSNDQPPLPKVLFADWLPMFSYSDQSSWALNGSETTTYRPELSFPSPELRQLEMVSANTGVHGMEDSSIYGGFQLQFEPVEPIPYYLSSFSEANTTGFELNHDLFF